MFALIVFTYYTEENNILVSIKKSLSLVFFFETPRVTN